VTSARTTRSASKNTPRRFGFTPKLCASILTTRSANYHLGFAQGVMGNRTAAVRAYQRAGALGVRNWDLFPNLGLAQLDDNDLKAATDNLLQAAPLGWDHSESHFALASCTSGVER
jgi:hypothetical protein